MTRPIKAYYLPQHPHRVSTETITERFKRRSKLSETAQKDIDNQLLAAAGEGDARKVYSLLSSGADRNATDDAGDTPLIVAARAGFGHAVIVLLEGWADPYKVNKRHESAFAAAISGNNLETAQTVRLYMPDIPPVISAAVLDAIDSQQWTPETRHIASWAKMQCALA